MCLITSNNIPYKATQDITAYKIFVKDTTDITGNTYLSPFRNYKYVFRNGNDLKLDITSLYTYNNPTHGRKYSIGGGVYHSLIDVDSYINYNEDKHVILKVTIPSGTEYFVSDNMNELASKSIIIHKGEISPQEAQSTDIADITQQIINDFESKSENVSIAYANDIEITIKDRKYKLLTQKANFDTKYKFYENTNAETGRRINLLNDVGLEAQKSISVAKQYYNGEVDTNTVNSYNKPVGSSFPAVDAAIQAGGYLPSSGELYEVTNYFYYINAYLANSDKMSSLLQPYTYWTSTAFDKDNLYVVNGGYLSLNNRAGKTAEHYVLPFQKA